MDNIIRFMIVIGAIILILFGITFAREIMIFDGIKENVEELEKVNTFVMKRYVGLTEADTETESIDMEPVQIYKKHGNVIIVEEAGEKRVLMSGFIYSFNDAQRFFYYTENDNSIVDYDLAEDVLPGHDFSLSSFKLSNLLEVEDARFKGEICYAITYEEGDGDKQIHYVTKEAKNLFPTELGEMVNEIMKGYFPDIVDIDFTANMEDRLDDVEMGKEEWKQIIRDFYPDFKESVDNAAEKLEKIEIKDEESDVICEKCGRNMVIKYGRYGKFLACPGFPECQNAKPYFEEDCRHLQRLRAVLFLADPSFRLRRRFNAYFRDDRSDKRFVRNLGFRRDLRDFTPPLPVDVHLSS